MVLSALMVSLAHGANDVANSISPLLVLLKMQGSNSKYAYAIGGVGISVGLISLGYKVMETVGKKVIKLDFAKGFSAQFATQFTVVFGTMLGLPLSTTHCAVGAVFGLWAATKLPWVKEIYDVTVATVEEVPEDEEEEEDQTKQQAPTEGGNLKNANSVAEGQRLYNNSALSNSAMGASAMVRSTFKSVISYKKAEENKLNKVTVIKILAFWLLTVPCALGFAALLTSLFLYA